MAERIWFYMFNGSQRETTDVSALRQMIASGKLPMDSMVWTEGMTDWAPVSAIKALRPQTAAVATAEAVAVPVPAEAAAGVNPMPYYNPGAGMPERAVASLSGYAIPRGDTGDWPLDDSHLIQFQSAIKARKRVTGAAQLYRSLFGLSIIVGVVFLIVALVSLLSGRRSNLYLGIGSVITTGVFVAFTVLYWLMWKATMKAKRWAPLTMAILFASSLLLQVASILLVNNARRDTMQSMIVGLVFSFFLLGAFIIVSIRSFKAIPEYLAHPAWCQELLVKAGL